MHLPHPRSLAAMLLLAGLPAVGAMAAESVYTITLRVQADTNGQIDALVVDETVPLPKTPIGQTIFAMAYVDNNVPTIASELGQLQASDAAGALLLEPRDAGEGDTRQRQWYAKRDVTGPLHFSYRAPMTHAMAARGAAPPIELRSEEGAFSGAGTTFLLHPPQGRYDIALHWDLDALGAGAAALSSLEGANAHNVDMDDLDSSYFMAGRIGIFPEHISADGFFSAWQGTPPFDASALLGWAQQLRGHYQTLFSTPPTPYGIFLRRNKVNPGGGMGMYHSFIATYDADRGNDPEELKITLAHEMFHTFQPHLTSEGHDDLSDAWFDEGTAVFYQSRLPFRYGMIDTEAFLHDINWYAARYYTNPLGNAPNSEVPARFWKDTRIRTLPYDRGFLYFATVDDAMRKASGGKRSLDDLILALLQRQREGRSHDQAAWEQLLRESLGEDAVAQLHAMLAGAAPLPASDAFGPCFERVSRPLRRYELGFAPAVLTESPRIVRELVAGSAAARAGVRNGDEITRPVGQDQIQGEQDGVLTLQLRRDGQPLTVAYVPRGEQVATWQWQLKPGADRTTCALSWR